MTSIVVAPWVHTEEGDLADPVNLVLDEEDATTVYNDLVNFNGSRWHSPSVADPLYLHVGDQELVQDEQAVCNVLASFRAAFSSILHHGFPHPILRYHIRLWNFPANACLWRDGLPPEQYSTCASAHVEPSIGIHDPISFELGEKFAARELKRAGYAVRFDDVPLGNQWHSPPNNGFATRLMRGSS